MTNRILRAIPSARPRSERDLDLNQFGSAAVWLLMRAEQSAAEPVVACSPGMQEFLGIEGLSRVPASQLLASVSLHDRDRVAAFLDTANEDPAAIDFSFERPLDGRRLRVRMLPGGRRADHAFGMWGSAADITDLWEPGPPTEADQAWPPAIWSGIPDAVLVVSRDGRIDYLNDAATCELGAIVGNAIREIFPSIEGEPLWTDLRGVIESGSTLEKEHFLPALGSWFRYRISPLAEGALIILRNTDQVHHLQALLKEMAESYSHAAEGAGLSFWEFESVGQTISIWEGARSLFGRVFVSWSEFSKQIHPTDLPLVERAFRGALENGEPFQIDYRHADPPGTTRLLRARGSSIAGLFDGSDRLFGVMIDGGGGLPGTGRPAKPESPQQIALPTGAQIRAARGMLRWSVRELAEKSQVSSATINRMESNASGHQIRSDNLAALHRACREHGVEFFLEPSGRPAVSFDELGGMGS